MRQGTTPTHTFTLPFDKREVKSVEATYAQKEKQILRKVLDGTTMDGKTVSITLTQEETFDFRAGELAGVQLRVLMQSGAVVGSQVMLFNVEGSLSKEVLV